MSDLPLKILEDVKVLSKRERLNANEKRKVLKRVGEEYKNAKISPGEAVGIVTAESFGEPGTPAK